MIMVALAAIVAIVWAATHRDVIDDDSPDYIVAAENLAEGRGMLSRPSPAAPEAWRSGARVAVTRLSELQGDVEATRTPGYPLFLALARLVGLTPRGATLLQHALHVALIGAFVVFARRIGAGRGATITASLWLIAEPYGRWAANHIVSETLFSVAVFAIVWLVADSLARREMSLGRAAMVGLLCGAATLIRPIAVLYCVPVAFCVVVWCRRRWAIAALLMICAIAPPLAWAARNANRTGIFTLSLIVPINRLFYTAAGAEAATMPGRFADNLERVRAEERARLEAMIGGRALTAKEKLDVVNALANDILRHHVRGAVLHAARDVRALLLLTYRCNACGALRNRAKDVLLGIHIAILLLAILGIIVQRDRALALFFALTIVYFICIGAGSGGSWGRFRVPVEPFYALCAATGGAAVLQRLRRRGA
jgi:hypothetical protein